jgi:DNA-binding response OmpR family regulator
MKFLLFDKEKKLYPIFGDILDITGHKLMVALDEKKAKDLLKAVSPDFLILRWKDIDLFGELLKEGYFVVPMFLVEDYQQAEGLKKAGFSDFNILILPFNPLEFLNKTAKLYRTLESLYDNVPSDLGMMNVL